MREHLFNQARTTNIYFLIGKIKSTSVSEANICQHFYVPIKRKTR